MERRIASPKIRNDHAALALIAHIESLENALSIQDGIIYYAFPLYRDESDRLYQTDVVLVSRTHGIVLFAVSNDVASADDLLSQLDSILYAKLLKSPHLRKDKRQIIVPITAAIYVTRDNGRSPKNVQNDAVSTLPEIRNLIKKNASQLLNQTQWKELISLLEGGKGIIRPKERDLSDLPTTSRASILSKLESEIANFDKDQRLAAITFVDGPQRIRGLAGSGKTIVLAMKAAHIHLRKPNAIILFTFWTKSLYELSKRLITRFYRQFDDRDPDWRRLHVRHAWGGRQLEGVYYNACIDSGVSPLPFRKVPVGERNRFDYVCKKLLHDAKLIQKYDYVLIDEGQDFPSSFYQLCFELTKGEKYDRNVIWAYDELQTILDTTVQNVTDTFGKDSQGKARMDLERAREDISKGLLPHDIVLHTCYRNSAEILVLAHSLGFGIYSREGMVQMLENKAHWEDLGYSVTKGNCLPGEETIIERPSETSPLSISNYGKMEDAIKWKAFDNFEAELSWIFTEIQKFLAEGLKPEDILIVCFDDRNARSYFKHLARQLSRAKIAVNNVFDQVYVEPVFFIDNHITLSTVYSAKGNEAAVVFGIGLDAIYPLRGTRTGRNRLFTVLTRAKAWLRLSGIGSEASFFFEEFETALTNFPYMQFKYPNRKSIDTLQRDLSERSAKILQMQAMIAELGLTDLSEKELAHMLRSTRKKEL